MSILFLLLLIPLICICLSLYGMTLINFVTINEFNITYFSLEIFVSIVLSYFIMRLIIKSYPASPVINNLDNSFSVIYGYISFSILAPSGIAFIANSIKFGINTYNLPIGILITCLYIFINYYFFKRKNLNLTLIAIDKIDNNLLYLSFKSEENDIYTFYTNSNVVYKENNQYSCIINDFTKVLIKIKRSANNE